MKPAVDQKIETKYVLATISAVAFKDRKNLKNLSCN